MVRGLDVFRDFFAGSADQFVLIGGTAATLAMERAGLTFRATKDLDIVLHVEMARQLPAYPPFCSRMTTTASSSMDARRSINCPGSTRNN